MKNEVNLTIDRNNLAIITINRPEARNALNWAAQEQFAAAIETLCENSDLRVVIITAVGNEAFISGGDLKEMAQETDPKAGERLTEIMGSALDHLIGLPVPVIAAVNGNAFGGGCELLTACDFRFAAIHARFSFAEVKMALSTGWGGTARLVNLIGLSRALDLLLAGRVFDAVEAKEIGFVTKVVAPDENVLEAAHVLAQQIIALPQDALAAAKELAWSSPNLPRKELRQLEVAHFTSLWLQPDHIEAMDAFAEKRRPRFNKNGN
jgi:enoyl-CoA hydratase